MGKSESGDWTQVALPSHIELSDVRKKKLESDIGMSLKEVLDQEPDDIMIEYLVVMILNGKHFAEITESMAELLGEDESKRLCENVSQKLRAVITDIENSGELDQQEEESLRDPVTDEKTAAAENKNPKLTERRSTANRDKVEMAPLTTKALRERRRRRQEEERARGTGDDRRKRERDGDSDNDNRHRKSNRQSGNKKTQLAQAYNLYLQSGYAGSFLEYQDYLKGIVKPKQVTEKKKKVKISAEDAEEKVKAMTWTRPGFEAPEPTKKPENQTKESKPIPAKLSYEERQEKLKSMTWSRAEKGTKEDKLSLELPSARTNSDENNGNDSIRVRGGFRGRGRGFRGRGRGGPVSGGFQHKIWVRPGSQAETSKVSEAKSQALSNSLPATP